MKNISYKVIDNKIIIVYTCPVCSKESDILPDFLYYALEFQQLHNRINIVCTCQAEIPLKTIQAAYTKHKDNVKEMRESESK